MFCDHFISSFTCILVSSNAIVLVSVGKGLQLWEQYVLHGPFCLAVRKMKLGDFL